MDENNTMASDFLVYNESSTEDKNLSIEPGEVSKVNIKFKGCGNCIHKDVCKYKDQMQDISCRVNIPYIPVLDLYAFCKNMESASVENEACEEYYTLLKHKYNLL